MYRTANSNKRVFGLVVTTALTGALLSGCTTAGLGSTKLAGSAEPAVADGQHAVAIQQAEAAVRADPRSAANRAALGSAYLDAGRFTSAATSFDDAVKLGDTSARTTLSLALALTGAGRQAEAATLLNAFEGNIPIADLGLALALAGQPERGVHLMGNAIRGGENTAKMRQNLAFAYALAGRWREARLMAEQDVPAGEVSDRIEHWAVLALPEAWQARVANLLSVPAGVNDPGQPVELALADAPAAEQLAAETVSGESELPAVAAAEAPVSGEPASLVGDAAYQTAQPALPSTFQVAFTHPAPAGDPASGVVQDGVQFVASPVVQAVPENGARAAPARVAQARPAAASARVTQTEDGTHLIQLGSFTSEQGARRAWSVYTGRYPELSGHQMVISEAVVRGKHYWRVSAAGFGPSSAAAACGRIKSGSQGCLAYAEGSPLPGAVANGTRLAQR